MSFTASPTTAQPAPPLHANITFYGDGTVLVADRCSLNRIGNGNYVIILEQPIDVGALAPFYYSFDRGRRIYDTGWTTIVIGGVREVVTGLQITTYSTGGTPIDTSLVVAIARTAAGLLPPV